MSWEFSDNVPIYVQIIARIKFLIVSGVCKPGDKLPTVREMAAQAGVNPNTMQKAFSELEREGLVFSQRTSGRFITEDNELIEKTKNTIADEIIRDFFNKMNGIGYNKADSAELINKYAEGENK